MFDTINGPPDHYSGPSAGLSTEKGDSWHTAVGKINAGFAKVKSFIENDVEAIDKAARKEIDDVRETIASMQQKIDNLEADAKAKVTAAAQTPPVAEEKPASTDPATEEKPAS